MPWPGAHDAYRFALTDTRVTAALLIDGYVYETKRHRRNRLRLRLRSLPQALKELLMGWFSAPRQSPANNLVFFEVPSQTDAAAGYAALLARGVRLGFVFTGEFPRDFSYADQHFEAFPALRGQAAVWHLPDADHTFTRRSARQDLETLIVAWLGRSGV